MCIASVLYTPVCVQKNDRPAWSGGGDKACMHACSLDCYYYVMQESQQVLENALVDKSIVTSLQHREHPVYQFERIGYFSVDRDTSKDKVCMHYIIYYH